MGGRSKTKTSKQTKEINKATCQKCNKECVEKPAVFEETSIDCDICQQWYHVTCAEMCKGKHDAISDFKLKWYCKHCDMGAASLYEMCVIIRSQQIDLKREVSGLAERVMKCEVSDAATIQRISVCEQSTSDLTTKVGNLKDSVLTDVKAHLLVNSADNPLTTMKQEIISEIKADITKGKHIEPTSPWKTNAGPTPQFKEILRQQVREEKEMEAIRENLVISGIIETQETSDIEKVSTLLREELEMEVQIDHAERCGKLREGQDKPRLLKIRISNSESRRKILQKAKNLRQAESDYIKNNIYIRPDQTRKQQEDSKNLRDELRARKLQEPEKTFKIIKGVVTEVNQA